MRLVDLLAGLSRVADLGFGLPVGSGARSAVVATRLAESLGLPPDEVRTCLYSALLHHVGCVGYAHETARLFEDELATNRAAARTDHASIPDFLTTFLPVLVEGRPTLDRMRLVATALVAGGRWSDAFTTSACEVARDAAGAIGLPPEVQSALFHAYDLWRGGSGPSGAAGEDIPLPARVARAASVAVLLDSLAGPAEAARQVRRRAGGMLDPLVAAVLAAHAEEWLAPPVEDPAGDLLALEPAPTLSTVDARGPAEVFGALADLKSPHLSGHAGGVAALAAAAAPALGLDPVDIEVAGHLHDVGRVAVSSAVWDKPGPLGPDEWEQVRLHPYWSERVLSGSTELSGLAGCVGRHHERLDGSGYHRGCRGDEIDMPARLLAAADSYRAMLEPRPHRRPCSREGAARRLQDAVEAGALDGDAVSAVLVAAGHSASVGRRRAPAGLSDREVEVLRLLARGLSNADIARRLVISPRTAEHHVQHVYTKVGVSSRAAATLFAVRQGLVGPDDPDGPDG